VKNYIFILPVILLASCIGNEQQQKKNTDNALKVVTEVSTNTGDTSCYLRTIGDRNEDSSILQLIVKNDVVTGSLQYLPYQKDARKGTLIGQKDGDIINAQWTYMQEGMEDTLTVSFKFKEGALYQKPNIFKPKLNHEVLDPRTDYELKYEKMNCK
jgi:hypothetical protein